MSIIKSIIFLLSLQVFAEFADVQNNVSAELLTGYETLSPGKDYTLALKIDHKKNWHSYWKFPGTSGFQTEVKWTTDKALKISEARWPFPHYFQMGRDTMMVYKDTALILYTLSIPENYSKSEITLNAEISLLICDDKSCVPVTEKTSLKLKIGPEEETNSTHKLIVKAAGKLPLVLAPENIHASQKGDSILLQFPNLEGDFKSAKFFPISLTSPVMITVEQGFKKLARGYELVIAANPDAENKTIEGVLVLDDKQAYTFKVDLSKSAVVTNTAQVQEEDTAHVDSDSESLLLVLVFAFLGGFILNLMPCVFPVISLKILSFAKLGDSDKSKTLMHGISYATGVILSFIAFALLIIAFQASGKKIGWGFQLQNPLFVSIIILVLLAVCLNLLSVFEVNSVSVDSKLADKGGLGGSFFSGVLATIIATPCMAPFMATAIGIALSKSPLFILTVFAVIGVGMASPYVLLSLFPALVKRLPKPGAWMETFKKIMAVPMIITVFYFAWVYWALAGTTAVIFVCLASIILSVALSIFGKWGGLHIENSLRKKGRLSSLLLLLIAVIVCIFAPVRVPESRSLGQEWLAYSASAVERDLADGKTIFIDFTADWCVSCKFNEQVAFTNAVYKEFADKNIVLYKADYTRKSDDITKALKSYGRAGVPLYILHRPGGKAQILPQLLTESIMLKAISSETE
ncbi:MAG: thioredoxin family protein [Lentisphaeria bacterium]|nr:thioredoxin family protein [Lentisphaeria bacterium]